MAGLSSLLEIFVSCTVELGGNGMLHGGKGILLAGARRIGWASSGSAGRQGRRFAGHSLAGKSLASGFGSGARGRLGKYDPKAEYLSRSSHAYKSAMRSGSGAAHVRNGQRNVPDKLFGRPGFDKPQGVLGRDGGHRYTKQRNSRPNSWSKSPRGHINFK